MMAMMPRRIIMTPYAARSRPATLLAAAITASPKNFIRRSLCQKTMATTASSPFQTDVRFQATLLSRIFLN